MSRSHPRWRHLALLVVLGAAIEPGRAATPPQLVPADAPPLTAETAQALRNPVANTAASVARGKRFSTALGWVAQLGLDSDAEWA